ncbi:MAG: IPTL-CTERM sorting domain-containing protein [Usitatibacter sp.]
MRAAFARSLLALLGLLFAGHLHAQTLYGADGAGGNPANLFTINPATGAIITTIGPIGFPVTGLAFHPGTGVLYGVSGGSGANPRRLIRINVATGAGTDIGEVDPGNPVADISFRANGTLYGWQEGADDLATINLTTGLATVVADSGLNTSRSGLAFAPNGTLYFNGDGNALHVINPATGQSTSTVPVGFQSNALAFNNAGVLFASQGGNLFTINTATGTPTLIGPVTGNLDALAFFVAAAPAAPTQVPTMSQWAMALMALLLAASAWLVFRRRG